MLRVGQIGSTAAVVNLARGKASQWTRGRPIDPPLADSEVLRLARLLFTRADLAATEVNAAAALVAELGGISSVIVRRLDSDIFSTLLPDSQIVLLLVMKHRDRTPAGSDMTNRGREVAQALLHQRQHGARSPGNGPGDTSHGHEASLAFWRKVLGYFTRSGTSTEEGKATLRPPRSSRWRGSLDMACSGNPYARFGVLFDLKSSQLLDVFADGASEVVQKKVPAAIIAAYRHDSDPRALADACDPEQGGLEKLQIKIGRRELYWLRVPYFPGLAIPFDPDKVLLLYKRPRPNSLFDWHALDQTGLDMLRNRIKAFLASGLRTQTLPFPRTQLEFKAIIDQLVELAPQDLIGRLDIGGFADHPIQVDDLDLRCKECIYFLPNRRWCDLPELPVPVEEDWYCRLWKV